MAEPPMLPIRGKMGRESQLEEQHTHTHTITHIPDKNTHWRYSKISKQYFI
jgi:hypothetical protein